MKKAIKAISIGDKLHNIERIHSKLVTLVSSKKMFSGKNNLDDILAVLNNLEILVPCFGKDFQSQILDNYQLTIKQARFIILNHNSVQIIDIVQSFGSMHGEFIKFRRAIGKEIKRGCERNYQDVCFPLLQIEMRN